MGLEKRMIAMKQKLQIKLIDPEKGYVLGTFTQAHEEENPDIFAQRHSGSMTFAELIEKAKLSQAKKTDDMHAMIRTELKRMLRNDAEFQAILTNFLISHPHLKVQY